MNNKIPSAPATFPSKLAIGLQYAAFATVRFTLKRLSLAQAASLSAFFWRMVAPRLKRHRRALANLALAMPSLSEVERSALLIRMWDNLGRTTAEALRLDEIADNPDSLDLRFSPEALAIMQASEPAIFVSLHYGNWETVILVIERQTKIDFIIS